jgi:prolyl 4-hydroxylase
LLQRIAPHSEVAKEHLELLSAMDIDAEGRPRQTPKAEIIGRDPEVRLFRQLLTPEECAHVARSVHDIIEPSYIVDPKTGNVRRDHIRTSSGAVVGPTRETLVIAAINRRLAAISDTEVSQGEPLSVLHYAPGEQYRPHLDSLPNASNQRVATVIVYLNHGYVGGETQFSRTGLSVSGRIGDAILFRNVKANGDIDHQALHAGLPVMAGRKWVATRWIRAAQHDPWSAGTGDRD